MFCTNCGKEVPDESKVCGYCGKELSLVPEIKKESNILAEKQPEVEFCSAEDMGREFKFNIIAFGFVLPWLIIKGMWDAVLINVILFFVCLIPILGMIVAIAWSVFWGRNGNYYCYLKKEKGISFWNAFKNPNLRRI